MAGEKAYIYRDPTRLATWLKIFIVLLVVSVGIHIVLLGFQYAFLIDVQTQAFSSKAEMMTAAYANDSRVGLSATLVTLLTFITAIMYFVWVYRVSANVHALGAHNLSATAGFAVGTYFIPFLNLVMPAVVMGEIRKASIDASNWSEQKGSPLIAIWWTLQILAGLGTVIVLAMSFNAHHGIDFLKETTVTRSCSLALDIVFRGALFLVVSRISAAQQAQYTILSALA